MNVCEVCGKQFEYSKNHPQQRFCSKSCFQKSPKMREYHRQYYKRREDALNTNRRLYQRTLKFRSYDRKRKRTEKYREYDRKYRNSRFKQIKEKLIEIIGGKICSFCKSTDDIQIDHINGGGMEDRRRFKYSVQTMRLYYVNHPIEARESLRMLCRRCNNARNRRFDME